MASRKSTPRDLHKATPEEVARAFSGRIALLSSIGEGMEVETLPTGLRDLDAAIGVGGFPLGRIVELYGPEGGGKTSISLHLSACAQRAGGRAAYIDAEHAIDPDMAEWLGVDKSKWLFNQPDSGEDALNLLYDLVAARAVDVVVVDSVAALQPLMMQEKDIGAATMGVQARLMSDGLRKLAGPVRKSNTIVIFINQTRSKIGVVFGNPEDTPGGKALKFYAGLRMRIQRVGSIKKNGEVIGLESKVNIVKNKVAVPFKTCKLQLIYNKGWRNSESK